ncbi:MAG TPA: ChbG/HpnK family deacetylase [Planctomycetota bacterium]|nr:ChbG/HpnK family deacetylase [Planctomycetota bacterium]
MILVVNADDAGVDEARNRGILRAARDGIVRSASVLAGFPAAEAFVALARATSISLGLHANFTEGVPLVSGHRSLVGEDGRFCGKRELWRRARAGLIDSKEARRELEAQWQRLLVLGAEPGHLDGHNHAHLFPGIAEAVAEAIPPWTWVRKGTWMRRPGAADSGDLPEDPYATQGVLAAALDALGARAEAYGWGSFRAPDAFVGVELPPGLGARRIIDLIDFLERSGTRIAEVMTHPGELCASPVPFSASEDRVREVEALTDPTVLQHVLWGSIRLAGFGDIA